MSADKSKADRLAEWLETYAESIEQVNAAAELRRIPALEAERDQLRARLAASEASDAESIRMYRAARDERDQLRAEVQKWSVLAASFEAERNLLREEISDLHKANAARKQQ